MLNGLSIDLEEWYHPQLVQRSIGDVARVPRILEATEPLLELLERHGARATFFCVGEVAREHPDLIRRLHQAGHEIAFHSMSHLPLWELDPRSFEAEVETFGLLIDGILGSGTRPLGFRAPTFSLDASTAWALEILARHGYAYDASVFPVRTPLYGLPGAPLTPYRISRESLEVDSPESSLIEMPPAVASVMRVRLPVGGGIYLRLLPPFLSFWLLRRINAVRSFVVYLHPWESDPGTPRLPLATMARAATYLGIDRMLGRVDRLLRSFRFTTLLHLAREQFEEVT